MPKVNIRPVPTAMADINLSLTLYGIKDLRLEDKTIPEPGPGEVQVSVRSVGICGSDVSFWQHGQIGEYKVKDPLILGHEPSGVISKLGEGVKNLKVGDRVAVEPNLSCGSCCYCRRGNYNICTNLKYLATPPTNGALCRYFCHSASFVHRLPDNVSFDEGALVQPLSLGFYACQRAGVNIGDYVLVSGAGPLGMVVMLAARARGAVRICVTDINPARLEFIQKIGADVTVLIGEGEEAKQTSQRVVAAVGREVDVSIECSGNQSGTSTAIYSTRPRGVVCQVGFGSSIVQIPLTAATMKELDIRGMIRFANTYQTVIEAIACGKVDVKQLITHRYSLENALEAYNIALYQLGVKVIIDCQRDISPQCAGSRCLLFSRKMSIQGVLVFLFFISVFSNVLILWTSITHKDHVDINLDLDIAVGESLVSLQDCVRKKMARNELSADNLPSSFVVPSYRHIKIPPAVDRSMLASYNWTVQSEIRRLKSVFKFLSRPVKFTHDFQYIHNPEDTCTKRKIDLVIAVSSSPEHEESRHRTRRGLKGSYSFVKSNNSTVLFFLGMSSHPNKSRKFNVDINMEMRMFGDIVQESYMDTYRNLTLKTISVLKWIDRFCPHAQFVLKSDDDVGIKPALAVSALNRYRQQFGNFILGRWNPKRTAIRNSSARTYVSFDDYPYATFPHHVLGGGMGFPVTTARLLYQAALRVKRIPLEDVYLSGLCAQRVNVPLFMDPDFDFIHRAW